MKKAILFALLVSTVTLSPLAAIGGIGLQLGQGAFTVASSQDTNSFATLTTGEFSNPISFGGFL